MGPDEFHEKYPDSDKAGLKNNAYTNVMVAWLLDKALHVLEDLLSQARREEMMSRLHLTRQELDRWEHITFRMCVPFLPEHPGVIAQFEGWDKLLVRSLLFHPQSMIRMYLLLSARTALARCRTWTGRDTRGSTGGSIALIESSNQKETRLIATSLPSRLTLA